MDLKTLERQTKGKYFHKKLPIGEGVADTISSKIWGVLYPTDKKIEI